MWLVIWKTNFDFPGISNYTKTETLPFITILGIYSVKTKISHPLQLYIYKHKLNYKR